MRIRTPSASIERIDRTTSWNFVGVLEVDRPGPLEGDDGLPRHPAGAGGEAHDPIRQEDRLGDRVGHQQAGARVTQPHVLQLEVHGVAGDGVEGAEGLVQQEHVGVGDERPADRGALGHPDRQLRGSVAPKPSIPTRVHIASARARRSALATPRTRSGQGDVLHHASATAAGSPPGRPPPARRPLRDPTGRPSRPARPPISTSPEAGRGQAGHDAQERGLAAARRADQRHELAVLDDEVDAGQGADRSVALPELLVDAVEADPGHGPPGVSRAPPPRGRWCRGSWGRCPRGRSSGARRWPRPPSHSSGMLRSRFSSPSLNHMPGDDLDDRGHGLGVVQRGQVPVGSDRRRQLDEGVRVVQGPERGGEALEIAVRPSLLASSVSCVVGQRDAEQRVVAR